MGVSLRGLALLLTAAALVGCTSSNSTPKQADGNAEKSDKQGPKDTPPEKQEPPEQPSQAGGAAEASPFDRLDPATIPAERRFPKAPPELVAVLDVGGACGEIAVSPNGKFLAWSLGEKVRVHDVEAGRAVDLDGSLQPMSLAFSPDGKTLAAACYTIPLFDAKGDDLYRPGLVRLWDMTQSPPKPLAPLEHVSTKAGFRRVFGEEDAFRGFGINPIVVAFAPDCKSVAVGTNGTSDDSEYLWLWDLTKKPPRPRTLGGAHWQRVEALAFAPDGKSLASGGFDGTIRLWDLTRDPPRPGPAIQATDMKISKEGPITGAEEAAVLSLAFSPDSKLLAASCGDAVVRLWDVTKAPPAAPTRLDWKSIDPVRCPFSSDCRLIASVGTDQENGKMIGRLILWDVASKQPRTSFDLPAETFAHVAFAPDGRHVVVGTERGIYVLRISATSPKK